MEVISNTVAEIIGGWPGWPTVNYDKPLQDFQRGEDLHFTGIILMAVKIGRKKQNKKQVRIYSSTDRSRNEISLNQESVRKNDSGTKWS